MPEVAYEPERELAKNAFDAGILGENGDKEQLEKLAQERDAKMEGTLSSIDEVAAEYSAEMAELGRLDNATIDYIHFTGIIYQLFFIIY